MNKTRTTTLSLLAAGLAAAGLLVACGGGSGGGTATTSSFSGSVVKGPVANADVCFYKVANGAKGDKISCVKTDATGAYTASLDASGDVLVEATGGTYTDEATGATVTLADPLQVVVAAQAGGTTVGHVTPLTTVAVSLSKGLSGGISSANFGAAASNVATQFQLGSVDLAKTKPDTSAATADAYGKALRALSEYIKAGGTLKTFTAFADPAAIAASYSAAFKTATGQTVSYSFNGSDKIVIGGTGAGGGTGSCGVSVAGSATANGITVPVNFAYCITGIAAGSCTSGNTSLSQAIAGQPGLAGGVNLAYTYSANCAPGAITITLK
jgi:hypothetical protein